MSEPGYGPGAFIIGTLFWIVAFAMYTGAGGMLIAFVLGLLLAN